VIFLLQDIIQVAKDSYPEEVGTREITKLTGIGRPSLNRTLRRFYKKYEMHPERYPITIRKVAKHAGGWRIKWRPEHARGMHRN
jgi:hypothetical protein